MKYQSIIGPIIISGFFLLAANASAVSAATLLFDPATTTTTAGQTINVKVNISTGTDEVRSADAFVSYDSNLLEAQSVSSGTFFETVFKDIKSTRVYVAGLESNVASTKKGSGTIATITFKAKQNGTATLSFVCGKNSPEDSTIIKASGSSNIIQCANNGTSAITIGTGSANPTATPTTSIPTPTPIGSSLSPTAIPSQLPQSGIEENIPLFATFGALLLLIGVGARMLL